VARWRLPRRSVLIAAGPLRNASASLSTPPRLMLSRRPRPLALARASSSRVGP